MRRSVSFLIVAATTAAFAAWQAGRLVVNGKTVPGEVIVRGGETYVPLSALRAGGARVERSGNQITISFGVEPGQMETDALEGHLNQWLNNGIFRARVTKVEPASDLDGAKKGFKVTVEVRNVSNVELLASDSGIVGPPAFYDDKGNALEPDAITWNNEVQFKTLAPAAGTIVGIDFWYPLNLDSAKMGSPDRMLVQLKPDADLLKRRKLHLSVKHPSLRFLLKSE